VHDAVLRERDEPDAGYIIGPFGKDSDLRRFGLALAARGSKTPVRANARQSVADREGPSGRRETVASAAGGAP
jgi:hypothetical protein